MPMNPGSVSHTRLLRDALSGGGYEDIAPLIQENGLPRFLTDRLIRMGLEDSDPRIAVLALPHAEHCAVLDIFHTLGKARIQTRAGAELAVFLMTRAIDQFTGTPLGLRERVDASFEQPKLRIVLTLLRLLEDHPNPRLKQELSLKYTRFPKDYRPGPLAPLLQMLTSETPSAHERLSIHAREPDVPDMLLRSSEGTFFEYPYVDLLAGLQDARLYFQQETSIPCPS